MNRLALIMAAGEGTRMHSKVSKVLHPLAGSPMLEHVLRAVCAVSDEQVIIVGHSRKQIMEEYHDRVKFAVQDAPKGYGTGYAVLSAKEYLEGRQGGVIVTAGDMPLVLRESYEQLARCVAGGAKCAMLTSRVSNPIGYGRVIRKDHKVVDIIEQKDLTPEQMSINEINASVYCFDIEALLEVLPLLKVHENTGECYITDAIAIMAQRGMRIDTVPALDQSECLGVNDRIQLAEAEKQIRRRVNNMLMSHGVTIIDPDATYIEPGVQIGMDTVVYPGCVIENGSVIGENCVLLPNSRISASKVGNSVKIESSVLLEAVVDDGTTVGPFAYLRPGARIGKGCRIGDYVEIKNSSIGDGTKISHLTYVGDSDLGKSINLGCGVVFVNYDGKRKQRSKVGDNAFIGCNVNVVAPVEVGENAYVAAGSTITENVPGGALSIARERQQNKPDWVAKRKAEGKL